MGSSQPAGHPLGQGLAPRAAASCCAALGTKDGLRRRKLGSLQPGGSRLEPASEAWRSLGWCLGKCGLLRQPPWRARELASDSGRRGWEAGLQLAACCKGGIAPWVRLLNSTGKSGAGRGGVVFS